MPEADVDLVDGRKCDVSARALQLKGYDQPYTCLSLASTLPCACGAVSMSRGL